MRPTISTEQTLPSGLIVEVSPWTTGDMIKMSNAGAKRLALFGNELFGNCRVLDDPRSVYGWKADSKINGKQLLEGDRVVLAILQRILSIPDGHEFFFEFESEDPRHRGKKTMWKLDLRRLLLPRVPDPESPNEELLAKYKMTLTDVLRRNERDEESFLPAVIVEGLGPEPIVLGDDFCYLRPLTEEALSAFQDGNRTPFEDLDGKKLWWRQLTGEDAVNAIPESLLDREGDLLLELLSRRIVEIEGVEKKNHRNWLCQWGWGNADELFATISKSESGVETELEVICSHSGRKQWHDAPLMNAAFFSQQSQRRRSGRR